MRIIGNILWLILGGLPVSLGYFIAGLLYCVTIIGIPFGYQLWKFGVFSLWPFGTEVVDGDNAGGCLSIFMNVCNMQHADGCFFAKLIPWFIHWRDSSSDVLF